MYIRFSCLQAILVVTLLIGVPAARAAEPLDLYHAVVVTPPGLTVPERHAVEMLVDEVAARSLARWTVQEVWPAEDVPVVAVGPQSVAAEFGGDWATGLGVATPDKPEGFRLKSVEGRGAATVFVLGNDARGVLFGCGRLLRELRMTREAVVLDGPIDLETAPAVAMRGHQMGFRPKVNSYDGWTVPMWEQYFRDLIVFGTNAVEVMPPRTDDADESPHFPLTKIDMMAEVSQLAKDYGIEFWIWYPAMDEDYTKPETVDLALKEWGEVFARLPYITTIFVPGGDPGHTPPSVLFSLLEKQTVNLKKFHPDATMWMSPQSFDAEGTEAFYGLMEAGPRWLSGIVYGPQNFHDLATLRQRVPADYPIRHYPDITHSIASQYSVPHWDPVYGLTENREVINPRPTQFASVFRLTNDLTSGFITYSEGCNDDANKILWSGLGWNPDEDVLEILRDYARYFIGPELEEPFAQGLMSLERNWIGPLLTNSSVETTWKQFEEMLREASPQVKLKWRFQQAIYRANYDAYNRLRLIHETALERQAMDVLRQADRLGAELAMDEASAILDRALTEPVAQDVRARVFEMAEALYQSVRMQLSVPRYQAIAVRRGANLDLIDYPLNSRVWLNARFDSIRAIESEGGKRDALADIVNWDNPGPGGYYDDLGQPGAQPHLAPGVGWEGDPERRASAHDAMQSAPDWRMSWATYAETLRDHPLRMEYTGLDPSAEYVVKATYTGDNLKAQLRLTADGTHTIHDYMAKPMPIAPVQFDVPVAATADGALVLEWNLTPGAGGAGRGCQVAEVWLMRK
ncbi:MAG: hypothetical protein JNK74_15300 [Candidatus Hydrogenedentes bacterium]|nr:hypothetical protein [Candidatus Hydrogenedentota bacterium]